MTSTASTAPSGALFSLRRLFLAGLAGGAVDFLYASCLAVFVLHIGFLRLWKGVAAGWMGPAARDSGWATAALGILTHFGIATVMAATYALVARRRPLLYTRWLTAGALYGLILYGVMYGVVLPLRFSRPWHWDGVQSVTDILAHVGVGVAIAYTLARTRKR